MRNVTIWKKKPDSKAVVVSDEYVRLFEYRGYNGTLNQFMFPTHVYNKNVGIRSRDGGDDLIEFNGLKGNSVIVSYRDMAGMAASKSSAVVAKDSYAAAVAHLIACGYEFWGDESVGRVGQVVRPTAHNRSGWPVTRHQHYERMAQEFTEQQYAKDAVDTLLANLPKVEQVAAPVEQKGFWSKVSAFFFG